MNATTRQMKNVTREIGQEFTGEQYLSFELDGEIYAVDILRVQEIKGWVPAMVIPNTPDYVKGVINLRGTVIPIIDMRKRFNLNEVEYTATTVVIVISIGKGELERLIGIVVDAVSDVLDVNAEDISSTPDFGTQVNTEYLKGLVTVDKHMVMLLDTERMFTTSEHDELDSFGINPEQAVEENE